jgi:phospholipid/cholesterol/gamma-HCH transport system permease protein
MAVRALRNAFEALGNLLLSFVEQVGGAVILAGEVGSWLVRPPYRASLFFQQMEFVGVGSLFIVLLTGTFTGMVFSLETVTGFSRFNAESLVGGAVALAVTRELAPVLAALMVTARSGSAMAAELGTMRVTEQIDALYTMAVNPVQYLIVPRVVACTLMVPVLAMVFNVVGIYGAYLVAVTLMGVDEGAFLQNVEWYLDPYDIYYGLIKASAFGFILSLISCFKGFYAEGGAKGVGQATTRAVVLSSVSIFVADYILTEILFGKAPGTF